MNWKFWNKKTAPDDLYSIETTDVPTSTLFRWFLYDTGMDNPNKFATSAGFNPISDEGEELELQDSIERLRRVVPLKSFIRLMSNITGDVLAESMMGSMTKAGLLDDTKDLENEKEALTEICMGIAMSSLVPAFAAALELGLIVNPGAFTAGDSYEF